MPRVLIADEVAEECARALRARGIEADHRGKLKSDELKAAIPAYDGLIVRSAVKVTREILEAGTRLKIVGRAGIGVDNIDVEAASRRGILVMNAPQGNVTSAAEHTIALMFANARFVSRGDAGIRAGRWDRKGNIGVELEGKTLGIVGLGKIGAAVLRTAKALRMRVLAHDPALVRERAEMLGAELVELDRLLAESDFVTLHLPLTDRTHHLIGARELGRMKRTARLINVARGGIVDEAALAVALAEKRIAGAALDVFEVEPPPPDHPLLKLDNVTMTPHLGASTEEAQLKVSVDIAEQFADYFLLGVVANAVNSPGVSDPTLAPYLRLADDLGGIAAQIGGGDVRGVSIVYHGAIGQFDTQAFTQRALTGALRPSLGAAVNEVSARVHAKERGVAVEEERRKDARNYKSLLLVRVATSSGTHEAAGTVFEGGQPRVVRVDDYDIDVRPSRHMLMMVYPDVPGMVGRFGTVLGERGLNIARMEVGRRERGQDAVILLSVDDPVTEDVVEELKRRIDVKVIHRIELTAGE